MTWEQYDQLLLWRQRYQKNARLTYDEGILHLVIVDEEHEEVAGIISMLLTMLVVGMNKSLSLKNHKSISFQGRIACQPDLSLYERGQ